MTPHDWAPCEAGTGRILGLWPLLMVAAWPAGLVIRLWRPDFSGPGEV